MKKIQSVSLTLCLIFISSLASASSVYTYSFEQDSSNGNIDISDQLSMAVRDDGTQAIFTFYNDVGINSSLAQVYFDDSTIPLFSDIGFYQQSAGVLFDEDGSGGNFGGSTFDTTFTSKKESKMVNGVDQSSEWVSFFGVYNDTHTFMDLIDSIKDTTFNAGLHLISINQPVNDPSDEEDKSEKFLLSTDDPVITPDVPNVPLPAALWLFAPALLGFMGFRRKNKA